MTGTFEIEGQWFMALNGRTSLHFFAGRVVLVNCETQAEVDGLWEKLSAGGEIQQCGWLKDRFGVSWQIIPTALGKMLSDPNPMKSKNVMKAMLQRKKIDTAQLQSAYDQE